MILAGNRVEIRASEPLAFLGMLSAWAAGEHLDVGDLEVSRPSLEDIYLDLTRDSTA